MSGLPVSGMSVKVAPPLLARSPSLGAMPVMYPVCDPLIVQCTAVWIRSYPRDKIVPAQSGAPDAPLTPFPAITEFARLTIEPFSLRRPPIGNVGGVAA